MRSRSIPTSALPLLMASCCALLLTLVAVARAKPTAPKPDSEVIDPESQTRQPLITLEVDDATLPDVAKALGTAAHIQIGIPPMYESKAASNQELFSLHAVKQPFWLVYEQLHQQHGILIQVPNPMHGDAIAFAPQSALIRPDKSAVAEPARWQSIHFHAGDFLVLVSELASAKPGAAFQMNWTLVADPRVQLSQVKIQSLDVINEAGDKLSTNPFPRTMTPFGSHIWVLGGSLNETKKPLGTKVTIDSMIEVQVDKKQTFKIHVKCSDVPVRQ